MTSYAEALVRQRNRDLARDDIEWALDGNGHPYLRDRFDWTAKRTRELESKSEQSRQAWKNAQAINHEEK